VAVVIDIGSLRQSVTLWSPSAPVADGDGGFVPQTYTPLDPPSWRCAIGPAAASTDEHHFADTVIAQASYVLTGRYHAGIGVGMRTVWTDRGGVVHTANVIGVVDPEGAGVQTVVLVAEVVDAPAPVTSDSWIQEGWTT